MAKAAVTAHPHGDGRSVEAPRHNMHIGCRWEQPCLEKFSIERELRSDLVLNDPVDPAEDARREAERVNDGNIGLKAPGLVLGNNASSDQALEFAQLYQRMCIVGVPGVFPRARGDLTLSTWLELLFTQWLELPFDDYLDLPLD